MRKTEKFIKNTLHCLVEPAGAIASGVSHCNVQIIDTDGSVIYDQQQEDMRKNEQLATNDARLASQCLGYRDDPVLLSLRRRYKAACADKDDELVHLYEIRDAMEKFFGDAKKAKEALKISAADWSAFGRICNADPLPQGRDRGRNFAGGNTFTPLDAGVSVASAREFAGKIIRRYVSYLSGQALP